MSLNYKVQEVQPEFSGLPDGEYTAQVNHVEYAENKFGNYYYVDWKILSPSQFESRVHQERYNVEHENNVVKKIAALNWDRFCTQIGGLKKDEDAETEHFLYKIATITLKNRIGKNDGKTYTNIVKMELIDNNKSQDTVESDTRASLGLPAKVEKSTASASFLNDDVPF